MKKTEKTVEKPVEQKKPEIGTDVKNLMVSFMSLVKDLRDFSETMTDLKYEEFVKRVAAVVEDQALKFDAFAKAAGYIKE